MHGLRELLLPLAVLADASERDRSLIATLELAALPGLPVVLPPKTSRVTVRVKQAAIQARERARCYQQWLSERMTTLDLKPLPTGLEWPLWLELRELDDTFEDAGQRG